jgi:hypothetical protein
MREVQEATLITLTPPVLVAGAGMVILLVAALVATSCWLRRRKQRTLADVGDPQVAEGRGGDIEDVIDVRVLRAQIRTLEEALEEALEEEMLLVHEPALPVESVRSVVGDEAVEELRRRIRSTVRGLSARMQDDATAIHVLARVEAAVDRLMVPVVPFVRPTLTVAHQVAMLPTEVAPAILSPVRQLAIEEAVPHVAIPDVPNTQTPSFESPYAAPVLDTPLDADEVVLPIPARTPSPEIRRGRRWLRRSAA